MFNLLSNILRSKSAQEAAPTVIEQPVILADELESEVEQIFKPGDVLLIHTSYGLREAMIIGFDYDGFEALAIVKHFGEQSEIITAAIYWNRVIEVLDLVD